MQQSLKSNYEKCNEVESHLCLACGAMKSKRDFYFHDREKKRLKAHCKECERAKRRTRHISKKFTSTSLSPLPLDDVPMTEDSAMAMTVLEVDFELMAKAFEILLGIDQRLRSGTP